MATAAEPHWKANERHMEKHIVAVHLLSACELNPVMVAISCLSGAEASSQSVWLMVKKHDSCLKEFEGPTSASGGL